MEKSRFYSFLFSFFFLFWQTEDGPWCLRGFQRDEKAFSILYLSEVGTRKRSIHEWTYWSYMYSLNMNISNTKLRSYFAFSLCLMQKLNNIDFSLHRALHVLHCTTLYCTVLHCTTLYCTVLHCTALHCIEWIHYSNRKYSDVATFYFFWAKPFRLLCLLQI